ncbi:NAD kinase [Verticiella sediminum]|uniref:NAD kinase n=1 Tax=Verticiella sediminum TaxID=1247510 RepID=A0A556AYM1_9BURK|nr:NAD kinase [Verticiella sediminum]TSH98033.1 NAD kinase [Verticiella sediminum]
MLFPTVALIGRHNDAGIAGHLLALAGQLSDAGREVLFEAETAANTGVTAYPTATAAQIGARASLAIVIGGDGTMLGAARRLARFNVPLVGINHGRVGFVTDIRLSAAADAIRQVLEGRYESDERILLAGTVRRGEDVLYEAEAFNDVVLSRAGRGGMIEMHVSVNGASMATMRADGLVIATPTGSTAYALSANGPILHPGVHGLVLVPVAPQALSNRPIVLPSDCEIEITLVSTGRVEAGASAHFDMQTWSQLTDDDRIVVRRAAHTIRLLHPLGYSYYATLRQKLNWNRMPSQGDSDGEDAASGCPA